MMQHELTSLENQQRICKMCGLTTHHEVSDPEVELIDQQQREIDHLSAVLGTTGGGVFQIKCFNFVFKSCLKSFHLHLKETYTLMYRLTSLGSPALLKVKSSDIMVIDR